MKEKTKKLTYTAVSGAIAFVLMLIDIPLPFIPSFLEFDISELPALLSTFMCGIPSGIAVCLIKNILHLFIGHTAGVGELSNFLLGTVLCLVAGLLYRAHRTRGGALFAMLTASLAMGAAAYPINAFIVYPFYYNIFSKDAILAMCRAIIPSIPSIEVSILIFNLPFTVAKGVICSLITFIIYKKLKKILRFE